MTNNEAQPLQAASYSAQVAGKEFYLHHDREVRHFQYKLLLDLADAGVITSVVLLIRDPDAP